MDFNGQQGDGGDCLPPLPINEQDEWEIIPFTDPRDNSTYDIIAGRVIVAWKNYTPTPSVDPNYFQNGISLNDTYYSSFSHPFTRLTEPAIAAFVAAENLTAFSEWTPVAAAGFQLPGCTSVIDAVTTWPLLYPNLIASVDPDKVYRTCDVPIDDPNDDRYPNDQWPVNQTLSSYHTNVREAWKKTGGLGSTSIYVAVLDTGVDYAVTDLVQNSSPIGVNTGDKKASTEFRARTSHGGEPWDWIKAIPGNAYGLGHGTSCCGVISAKYNNNDPNNTGTFIAGMAQNCKYVPIAMKYKGVYSGSSIANAYLAVGCIMGRCKPNEIYGPGSNCPSYNIRIASCSFGGYGFPSSYEVRLLNELGPYVLFVCAAGNGDNKGSPGYSDKTAFPASHGYSLAVAAHDKYGNRPSWSNYQQYVVRISGPGEEVPTW